MGENCSTLGDSSLLPILVRETMKIFIIKISVFCCILLLCLMIIGWSVPYYWGEPCLVAKMASFKQRKNEFNTLFIGSSRVYRGIDPSIFDSLTLQKTKSFNLGIRGMNGLEVFEFYNNFLHHDISPSLKYVIMELQDIPIIADRNLHTIRSQYYLNYQNYMFAIKYFYADESLNKRKRVRIIKNYTIAYSEKLFKIGLLKPMLIFLFMPDAINEKWLGKSYDGFYPLEEALGHDNRRWKSIRKNPRLLESRLKRTKQLYQQQLLAEPNKIYLQKLQNVIEQSQQHNIHIIFLIFPLSSGSTLLPVVNKINSYHKIDLANPFENAEFYTIDYCFDKGHLNDKGAKLFTERLAEKFNHLFIENKNDTVSP